MVEDDAGEASGVAVGARLLHEGSGGVREAVQREAVDVGLHGQGRVDAVRGAVVAGPWLLRPLRHVPQLAAGHVPAEEDVAHEPIRRGARRVDDAEALGNLLSHSLP